SCHLDGLGYGSHLEVDIYADLAGGAQLEVGFNEPSEPRRLGCDRVVADYQVRKNEVAVRVGGRLPPVAVPLIRRRHSGVGDDGLRILPNEAGDLAGVELRPGHGRG